MSTQINTEFFERVAQFLDETDGMSWIPAHAQSLLDNKEYEQLEAFMRTTYADLSIEHFHATDQIEATDVY